MKLLKYGDTREDGMRFMQYQKGPTGIMEKWVSPEWFELRSERNRVRMREYKRRKAAERRQVAAMRENRKETK